MTDHYIIPSDLKGLTVIPIDWDDPDLGDPYGKEYFVKSLVTITTDDFHLENSFEWYDVRVAVIKSDLRDLLFAKFKTRSVVSLSEIQSFFPSVRMKFDELPALPKKGELFRANISRVIRIDNKNDEYLDLHINQLSELSAQFDERLRRREQSEEYFNKLFESRRKKTWQARQREVELAEAEIPKRSFLEKVVRSIFIALVAMFLLWWITRGMPYQDPDTMHLRGY